MTSLSARIAWLIFAVEIVVLAVFGMLARGVAQRELLAAFDGALRSNAEALATLTEVDRNGAYEFEATEKGMPRFERADAPDLFAIMADGSSLVAQSKNLLESGLSGEGFRDFTHNRHDYRSFTGRFQPGAEEPPPGYNGSITVFYATSREGLDAALLRVTTQLVTALVVTGILSALLAAVAARRGMRPLRGFAQSMDHVTADSLGFRFDVAAMPQELRRPAQAFNELAQRIEQALARERRFSADAAHELRTPVAALKVAIQAAQRSPRDVEEDTQLLADLEAEAIRLEDLCEQLLILTRTNTERDTSLPAAQWLKEVQRATEALAATNGRGRIRVIIPGGIPECSLRTSAPATQRITTNLVSNALLHGGNGVTVTVTVEPCSHAMRVLVDDDGAGIPPAVREKVFDRFFRGDSSRVRDGRGAGLGLSLSREIARASGGDVVLREKETPGALFEWQVKLA